MKKLLISIVIMLLVYVSSMALEPVRVGLTYPSGLQDQAPKVEVDVFDYNGSTQKYPIGGGRQDFGNIQANASGGAQIILGHNLQGEDDPDWGPLSIAIANNSTMVRVYVAGSLVTQLKLKDLIEAQQTTGDGDVIPSGIDAQGGVISTGDPDDDLVIGGSSVDSDGSTETKMFFNNTKAAFRAGTVSGTNWNEANLGQSSSATGENTTASGDHSSASGEGTVARATHEVAVGSYNTDDAVAGDNTDKAFSIGNGTGTGSRSNAFVVRKNGNTEITGKVTIGSGATAYELPSTRGTDKQILQSDANGVLTFVDNVPGLGTANTWTAIQTFEAGVTIGDVGATTHYTLPTTRGTDKQILQSDASGALTFVDNTPPAIVVDSTLTGAGTDADTLRLDLSKSNSWSGTQTFNDVTVSNDLSVSNDATFSKFIKGNVEDVTVKANLKNITSSIVNFTLNGSTVISSDLPLDTEGVDDGTIIYFRNGDASAIDVCGTTLPGNTMVVLVKIANQWYPTQH